MTPAEMEAGREMDALIAEHVMGWSAFEWDEETEYPGGPIERVLLGMDPHGDTEYPAEVPHYSTDIAAAWQVVEKLGLSMVRSEDGWYAIRPSHPKLIGAEGEQWEAAATAPLAICRAALSAASPTPLLRAGSEVRNG